jgi:O-antigen/teichoic acid export membrane protein
MLKIKKNSLFNNSIVYVVSSSIASFLPFLLLPLLTKNLSVKEFGIIGLFQLVNILLYPLVSFNLESYIQKEFFVETTTFRKKLVNVFAFYLSLTGVFFLFYFWIGDIISSFIDVDNRLIFLALITAWFQFLVNVTLVIFQLLGKVFNYGIFQTSYTIISNALVWYLLVECDFNYDAKIYGQLLGALVFSIVGFGLIIRAFSLNSLNSLKYLDKVVLRDIFKFCLPLVYHSFGLMLFFFVDRYLISSMIGFEELGLFTVAFQLSALFGIITGSFNNAYVPWLYEKLAMNDYLEKVKIVKTTYIYIICLFVVLISFSLVIPFFFSFMINIKYNGALKYIPYLLSGFFFQGLYYLSANHLIFLKRTFDLSLITVIVAILKFPMAYYIIKVFGSLGASISFSLSFLLYSVLVFLWANRSLPMPWLSVKSSK